MKIAISSNDGKIDTTFSLRFGRCEYFLFVDSETRDWETIANPAATASGGAGSQVVQFLSKNGIEATITGHYGPTAFTALEAAGIKGYEASKGTPKELLAKLLAGKLKEVDSATGPSHHH